MAPAIKSSKGAGDLNAEPDHAEVSAPHGSPTPRLGRAIKTSERVASAIVADIVASNMKPGDRLPNEAAMVDQFQIGRGSLREALRILEVHGLISMRSGPGGGPVITEVDPRDVARTFSLYLHLGGAKMRELIEARLYLEPVIARMAAESITPENLAKLEAAVDSEGAIADGDPRFLAAANNFHYVLATLSGNSVIGLIATALKEPYTSRVVSGGLITQTEQARLRTEHKEIARAIAKGETRKAERLAREHTSHYLGLVGENEAFAESPITWE